MLALGENTDSTQRTGGLWKDSLTHRHVTSLQLFQQPLDGVTRIYSTEVNMPYVKIINLISNTWIPSVADQSFDNTHNVYLLLAS